VILVDDGIATGETMKAAIRWLKSRRETSSLQGLVVAVPVCSRRMLAELALLVDDIICLYRPRHFYAVGQFYQQFEQVSDAAVLEILHHRQQGALTANV
jgi:predicted phosphoribosyltransferase